jgi:hypothetical protein
MAKACKRHPDLEGDLSYAGTYCVYCGESVARLEIEAGQIALAKNSGNKKKYLAVEYGDKQSIVQAGDTPDGATWDLRLNQNEQISIPVADVVNALQRLDELLILRKKE